MERQEFLAKLGITMAAVCTGCSLVGCGGSKSNDPGPSTGGGVTPPPPGSGAVFSVNLDSDLQAVGSSKVSNGVILVRLAAGSTAAAFTAVQVACTHQGTNINYNTAQGIFICPNHGSEFNTSGAVVMGPASAALKHYTVVVDGSTLTVNA
ncbi:Rieske (2Fe-2S) protein [Inquilinus sp. KBS0705]|nr:Rieske (2Fe-2S) protein [Inquilinus sp. KBS0705]